MPEQTPCQAPNPHAAPSRDHASRWISKDFSILRKRVIKEPELVFDVVIIGSGYGGSMAAAQLTGMTKKKKVDGKEVDVPVSVCVLERGKEYVPGMFASSLQELPSHVRVQREKTGSVTGALDALIDLRIGEDVSYMAGNGLGGGSLINAGVMQEPNWADVERMPLTISRSLTAAYFTRVKAMLRGTNDAISMHPRQASVQKTGALRSIQSAAALGSSFKTAALTVEFTNSLPNNSDVHQQCTLCGDCMTGCNVGAKKSLDTTLLLDAWKLGADIFTGATVARIKRIPPSEQEPLGYWELHAVYTDKGMRRRHSSSVVKARKVIVAAGTLGSTELLMRSQGFGMRFSPRLGQQFSCNGDNLVALHRLGIPAQSTVEEHVPLTQPSRSIGPTITAMIDMPAKGAERGFLVQEFAIPAPLKRLFDEVVTTSKLLHSLPIADTTTHTRNVVNADPLAVNPADMNQTLLVGLIGHDESNGELVLADTHRMDSQDAVDGHIRIRWPHARYSPLQDKALERLRTLVGNFAAQTRANPMVLPNPQWRPLPDALDELINRERGPVVTVHPLGGCAIGDSPDTGVVNEYGEVFVATREGEATPKSGAPVHDGLVVLDGSIIPASLGANPALTIAAIALRACEELKRQWKWTPASAKPNPPPLSARPVFRAPAVCTPRQPIPTEIELIERLSGEMVLNGQPYIAELTLYFESKAVTELLGTFDRSLSVAPTSRLRLYEADFWDRENLQFKPDGARGKAALVAHLSGKLCFLFNEESTSDQRGWRALGAWQRNRGRRDFWQRYLGTGFGAGVANLLSMPKSDRCEKWQQIWNIATHAGEARLFYYDLVATCIEPGAKNSLDAYFSNNKSICGHKRITYERRANPWHQLTRMELTRFGNSRPDNTLLHLDLRFLARQGVPLLAISKQQNGVVAMAELASLGLLFLRVVMSIHLWTFRAPDPMPKRVRQLLPVAIPGLKFEVTELEVDQPREGLAVRVRLSRYFSATRTPEQQQKPPLVLIHGYSAGGNTFTHEAIKKPMAKFFCEQGRDVWVLDLRTSPGMPSAILPWNFEDAALSDIPLAIRHIRVVTGHDKVDVFAHCIGAAMLSMALMTDVKDQKQLDEIGGFERVKGGVPPARRWREVAVLPRWINKIVLCQKGPAIVYSDRNVLSGYLMRTLRKLVLPDGFQFKPTEPLTGTGQLLDRLLSSLPYPDDEYDIESPCRPCKTVPWAGFRHRMDALYGRDFSLANIPEKTLDTIEDLFGPLNLDTVAQAIHFVRNNKITNAVGRDCFVTDARMAERWPVGGTMSIHGEDNGLADVQTVEVMSELMHRTAKLMTPTPDFSTFYRSEKIPGYGHQDCLIGKNAELDVFKRVEEFLA